MLNTGGRKSSDSVFIAAGEKAGLQPRASEETDKCNVSTDAKPGSNNELLEELERRVLCE